MDLYLPNLTPLLSKAEKVTKGKCAEIGRVTNYPALQSNIRLDFSSEDGRFEVICDEDKFFQMA